MIFTQTYVGEENITETVKKMKMHPEFSERKIKYGASAYVPDGYIRFEIFDEECDENGSAKKVAEKLCTLVEKLYL